MAEKFDFKKEYRDLYLPKKTPAIIDVPPMDFIMVDGTGAPGEEAYQAAMSALYSLTFTIKMSKMTGNQPDGYFEYVVPPLEGLWHGKDGPLDLSAPRDEWRWTSIIRQPEFVTDDVFRWAVMQCREKKPEVDVSGARFERLDEGKCVQIMHVGPYSEEGKTIEKLRDFAAANGFKDVSSSKRRHHEIYLSDPRRTAPEKLRTVIRLPVE